MKKAIWLLAVLFMFFLSACSVEPTDSNYKANSDSDYDSDDYRSDDDWGEYSDYLNNENSIKKWNWTRDDCESFGGVITSTGGCYLACSSDDDCPEDSECWGGTWSYHYCQSKVSTYGVPSSCTTGYGDDSGGYDESCNLSCDMAYGDLQCPSNFRCAETYGVERYGLAHDGFCTGYVENSGGGGSGYCSGCGGIFCSGDCIGCPGC